MTKVKIGAGDPKIFDGRANWIHEHLTGRQEEGHNVCVQVTIQCGDIDFMLVTPGCGGSTGNAQRTQSRRKAGVS